MARSINKQTEPVQLPYGVSAFRGDTKGIAQAFKRMLANLVSFTPEPVPEGLKAAEVQVAILTELREIRVAIERQLTIQNLSTIHVSDEMTSIGFTARQIQEYLKTQTTQRRTESSLEGLEGGMNVEPDAEPQDAEPTVTGTDDIPF